MFHVAPGVLALWPAHSSARGPSTCAAPRPRVPLPAGPWPSSSPTPLCATIWLPAPEHCSELPARPRPGCPQERPRGGRSRLCCSTLGEYLDLSGVLICESGQESAESVGCESRMKIPECVHSPEPLRQRTTNWSGLKQHTYSPTVWGEGGGQKSHVVSLG